MTWRRGILFILAVFAFILIQRRAPDMLSEDEASVSKVARVEKDAAVSKSAQAVPAAAAVPIEPAVSYLRALNEDRFCDVVDHDSSKEPDRTDFMRSLELDQVEAVRELASADSPYVADANLHTYTSPAARFMQALQLAQMLEGNSVPKTIPSLDKARELLQALSDEDPRNAAYSVFLLKVDDELDRGPEDQRATIARIMEAEYFNAHTLDLNRVIRERAQVNAAKFWAAISVVTTMPVPALQNVKIVQELDFRYPGLKEKVGRLLIKEALGPRTKGFLLDGFSPIEYSLGRSFLTDPLPHFAELDRSRGLYRADFSAGYGVLLDKDGNRLKCDDTIKTDFYSAMREIL